MQHTPFVAHAREVRGMNFHEKSSTKRRDTAEKLNNSSSKEPINMNSEEKRNLRRV
jgi:hypothetical protein